MFYQQKENGSIQNLPFDKFQKLGAQQLTDEELIAILLRTGNRNEDAVMVAHRLLSQCMDHPGLLGLQHLSLQEIRKVKGIGQVKAIQLKAVAEITRRMQATSNHRDICFDNPKSIADFYMQKIRHLEKEHCYGIFLDARNAFIANELLSVGNLNSSIISAREIFRQALLHNAAFIVLLHNHPSGDPSPSRSDIEVTQNLHAASVLFEIPLLDHIIIGDNRFISMKEKGVF